VAAREFLAEGSVLRSTHGVLTASHYSDEHQLRTATQAPDLATKSLSLEGPEGRALAATVLPLTSGLRRDHGQALAATAAVFVHDPPPIYGGVATTLAGVFGLTGAEARILASLLEGHTVTETAERYEISTNTVRTHVQRLFAKTSTSRQSELLRVASVALPPVRQSLDHQGPTTRDSRH
jgi:DNA-binding CsgD family transcriptional regulator